VGVGEVPVKVTSRLAEAKTSWALASLSLISFASYYRFTIVYIVISFIFIESACLTGWPSPLSKSSPAANQSRRGEYTKVAALQVGLLSLNVLADAASSNSLCRQVSLFSYLQF